MFTAAVPGVGLAPRPPHAATLATLSASTLLALWALVNHPTPFEDAAMLLRYADHLGAGHGLVWNVREAPVDGATDFLYLVMVGGAAAIGVPTDAAGRAVSLVAHLATVMRLDDGIPSLYRVPWWWGAGGALAGCRSRAGVHGGAFRHAGLRRATRISPVSGRRW